MKDLPGGAGIRSGAGVGQTGGTGFMVFRRAAEAIDAGVETVREHKADLVEATNGSVG